MPISAEQWRVKTGMINASRGLRQLSMRPPPLLLGGLPPPPPSDWRGYILALTLLWLPLLYKVYELGVAVLVGLVRGESRVLDIEDCFTDLPQLHYHHWIGLLIALINIVFYLVVMVAVFLMGRSHDEYTECNKQQLMLCCLYVENGVTGGLREVSKFLSSCVCATFMIEQQNKATRRVVSSNTVVSSIIQLSTMVLAMLLLLSGDVERNPGPTQTLNIKTLVNELKPAMDKYHEIGVQLGIDPAILHTIELDHPKTERRLYEVLLHWLQSSTDICSWESIIDVLVQVDRIDLASSLVKKYCPNKKDSAGIMTNTAQSNKIFFPILDTSSLDDAQKQLCQNLSADMDRLSEKFQDLIDGIRASLKQEKVPIGEVVASIRAFQAFEPVYGTNDSRPILEHRMTELWNAKSIDDAMNIIVTYSSYFNYHLVGRIIKSLGTDNDLQMLSEYEEQYRLFAEHIVYECPTTFQGPADTKIQRQFMVKVDDTFEKCTESHLKRFMNKLSEVLKLSEGTLSLESIRRGCLELTLQSPLFVFQSVFPLSSDQERALAAEGVIKISAGDYQYPIPAQEDGDSDDNGDKPDDGSGKGSEDSGIDTLSTILSELSERAEEVIRSTSSNPYDIQFSYNDTEISERKRTLPLDPTTSELHTAAFFGELEHVKILLSSGMFIPLEKDDIGNTALHCAVHGSQLNVVKYFIEEQEWNPSDSSAYGEQPLHIACRLGDLEMVKYLVMDQKIDPMCEETEYGVTALHAACIGGNIDIIHLLVKEMSIFLSTKEISEEKTKLGSASVHYAVANGHLNIVKYILSDLNCDPNLRGQYGWTPLHLAALFGRLNIVKYLMHTMHCDPTLQDSRKRTPFFLASTSKSLPTVKFLANQKRGSDAMSRDNEKNTLLHLSASTGNVQVVEYLISELKCDPHAKNTKGATPLHFAAQSGHVQVVKYFIDKTNSDPLLERYSGNTVLHLSAAHGHVELLQFLIAEMKYDPNLRGEEGATPLHLASQNGQIEAMKFLINNCNCECSLTDDNCITPLHCASRAGHLNAVKLLTLDNHCDPNCTDKMQATPLHYATMRQHIKIVEFFINDLNCDPNLPVTGFDGSTPLHFAVENGDFDTVKLLSRNERCTLVSMAFDASGSSVLHLAAKTGQLDMVKFLISEFNCDPNSHNKQGLTPLHMAASGGHIDVMEYLIIDTKGDPSQLDYNNATPLHHAAQNGHVEAIEFLSVDQKCDPCCSDQDQNTPIHLAAFNGHMGVLKFLISDLKCNPIVTNKDGKTPRQLAMIRDHDEITKYLKEAEIHVLYTNCPLKTISSALKEGDNPLFNTQYSPPFNDLPHEKEFQEFYVKRNGINWFFMGEIVTDNYNTLTLGTFNRNLILVCDRSGKDSIPILFYNDPTNFNFAILKKGHTLIVQQAAQHHYHDEIICLRIEILSTLLVIPCSMKGLFDLSALYYKNKDTKCWSCGKSRDAQSTTVESLKKCGACKVAYYCSKECQAKDWKKRHRKQCKVMPDFMKLTQL